MSGETIFQGHGRSRERVGRNEKDVVRGREQL